MISNAFRPALTFLREEGGASPEEVPVRDKFPSHQVWANLSLIQKRESTGYLCKRPIFHPYRPPYLCPR